MCLVCSLHLPRWIRAHLFSAHKWNVAEEQPSAETRPGLWRSGWRRQGLHCVFTASSLRSLSVLLVRCHVSSWAGRDWVIYITGFLSERNTGSRCWGGTLLFSTPTSGEVFQSLAKIPCDYKNDKVSTKRRNMNHCSRKSPLCPVCQDASVLCGCWLLFFFLSVIKHAWQLAFKAKTICEPKPCDHHIHGKHTAESQTSSTQLPGCVCALHK